jgi:hypothetical protein
MTYYTIVNELGVPVLPLDENPDSEDEGLLVYRSLEAAQAAADYQMFCYDLESVHPLPLHSLEERLDAQEPQPEPLFDISLSLPAAIAILLACIGGVGVLVALARAVWG